MPTSYQWPIEQMIAWYDAGHTYQEIADALAGELTDHRGQFVTPVSTAVRKVLAKAGCQSRPSGAKGERNGSWKGGRHTDKDGYVWVYCPDHPHRARGNYVQEHRLVAERVLGRYLLPEEVVHHKDDDHGNNEPDNLVVYPDNATHMRETRKGKVPNWSKSGYRRVLAALVKLRKGQAERRKAAKSKPSAGIDLATR